MKKVIPITGQFHHFLAELKESFGEICSGRRSWPGSDFGRSSHGGNGTGIWGKGLCFF